MCNGKWGKVFQAVLDFVTLGGRFWLALAAWWKEKKRGRQCPRRPPTKKPISFRKGKSSRGKRRRKK